MCVCVCVRVRVRVRVCVCDKRSHKVQCILLYDPSHDYDM